MKVFSGLGEIAADCFHSPHSFMTTSNTDIVWSDADVIPYKIFFFDNNFSYFTEVLWMKEKVNEKYMPHVELNILIKWFMKSIAI